MSTTSYDVTATTIVIPPTVSTPSVAQGTESLCSGSLDCYDVTVITALISPTASTPSVAQATESLCSGSLECYGTCVKNFTDKVRD